MCRQQKSVFKQYKSHFLSKSLVIPRKSRIFAALEPAKPLNDAQMCGSFYFYTMSNRIPFQKTYASVPVKSNLLLSSHASPLQIPYKSHFSPIHRNGLEADYKRRKSEPIAEVERRMNEGIQKDAIRSFENWCNTLKMKKSKSFLRGYYTF